MDSCDRAKISSVSQSTPWDVALWDNPRGSGSRVRAEKTPKKYIPWQQVRELEWPGCTDLCSGSEGNEGHKLSAGEYKGSVSNIFLNKLLPIFVQRIWMSFGLVQWNVKQSAVELLCWAVLQERNSGRETRCGNVVLASWWKHPAGGFPHHCSWRSSLVQRGMGLGCPACFIYLNCNIGMGYGAQSCITLRKWDNLGIFFPLDIPHDCFVPHKWERNSERFHVMIINFTTCHLISYMDSDWVLGMVSVRIMEKLIWRGPGSPDHCPLCWEQPFGHQEVAEILAPQRGNKLHMETRVCL